MSDRHPDFQPARPQNPTKITQRPAASNATALISASLTGIILIGVFFASVPSGEEGSWPELWSWTWRCSCLVLGCLLLAFDCAVLSSLPSARALARDDERRYREAKSNPRHDGTTPEIPEPSASLKLQLAGDTEFVDASGVALERGIPLIGVTVIPSGEEEPPQLSVNESANPLKHE